MRKQHCDYFLFTGTSSGNSNTPHALVLSLSLSVSCSLSLSLRHTHKRTYTLAFPLACALSHLIHLFEMLSYPLTTISFRQRLLR